VRRALAYDDSAYSQLFRTVGCQYGDAEHLVAQDGVEGAMHALYRAGIWLSVDELKGRRPVVRGSTTIPVNHAFRSAAARGSTPGG
jgi:hypothetical protein